MIHHFACLLLCVAPGGKIASINQYLILAKPQKLTPGGYCLRAYKKHRHCERRNPSNDKESNGFGDLSRTSRMCVMVADGSEHIRHKDWPMLIKGTPAEWHYDDVVMGAIASQITSLTIVYASVYSGADQSKHQSSASLAFVWGIHRGPGNSPHKWPVTRKMFPFDDVIMEQWKTARNAPASAQERLISHAIVSNHRLLGCLFNRLFMCI